jgi:hypothetical protein
MSLINFIDSVYEKVFSEKMQKKFETFILFAATIGFIIHLSLIGLNYFKILDFNSFEGSLLSNPISAIYTPFSFILVYEIYLLLLYLPRSFSTSISKQFEIVSLIVIRKIFKDIPSMDFSENWFISYINLELLINLIGVLIIFYLIFLFKLNKKRTPIKASEIDLKSFIRSKKIVSLILCFILLFSSVNTFSNWIYDLTLSYQNHDIVLSDIDDLFFNDFFSYLILTDVVILLISFKFTMGFSKVLRNTGFIISTILLRLSFSASQFFDIILILISVTFALMILKIYNATENSS